MTPLISIGIFGLGVVVGGCLTCGLFATIAYVAARTGCAYVAQIDRPGPVAAGREPAAAGSEPPAAGYHTPWP